MSVPAPAVLPAPSSTTAASVVPAAATTAASAASAAPDQPSSVGSSASGAAPAGTFNQALSAALPGKTGTASAVQQPTGAVTSEPKSSTSKSSAALASLPSAASHAGISLARGNTATGLTTPNSGSALRESGNTGDAPKTKSSKVAGNTAAGPTTNAGTLPPDPSTQIGAAPAAVLPTPILPSTTAPVVMDPSLVATAAAVVSTSQPGAGSIGVTAIPGRPATKTTSSVSLAGGPTLTSAAPTTPAPSAVNMTTPGAAAGPSVTTSDPTAAAGLAIVAPGSHSKTPLQAGNSAPRNLIPSGTDPGPGAAPTATSAASNVAANAPAPSGSVGPTAAGANFSNALALAAFAPPAADGSAPAPTVAAQTPAQQPATTQMTAAMAGVGPIQANGSDGGTRLTIAMTPPAIGMVSIQIDRAADGTSAIAISATHPVTLAALQTDHAALQQMLTLAGVPVDHRTVTFHLEPITPDGGTAAQTNTGPGGGFGQGTGQGTGQPAGDQASGGSTQAYDRRGSSIAPALDSIVPASSTPQATLQMRRFGVNMMA
jgi:hypothetical protein